MACRPMIQGLYELPLSTPNQAAMPPSKDGPRINEFINAHELLVIDDEGGKRGVMSKFDALKLAQAEGLDLVEVAPLAKPPVVKPAMAPDGVVTHFRRLISISAHP